MNHPAAIGPYRLTGVLGQGGMGSVYRGQAPDGRAVAIKLSLATQPEDLLRFERECRLQRQLGGEGLLPLLDAGQVEGRPYAVLPLLEGGDLQARLRRGALPWEQALELVERLARAVARMHDAGVVHRDLKPANVLFDGAGNAWVADLGLSKHSDRGAAQDSVSLSQTGGLAGSKGFMAPEQAMDSKRAGPPADVFSLGAILYTAIAGREPYAGTSLLGYLKASALGDVEPLRKRVPDVPEWLDALVLQTLSPEPEDRPLDAGVLASLLVRPRAAQGRAGRWGWIGAVCGLILVGGAALVGWRGVESASDGAELHRRAGAAAKEAGRDADDLVQGEEPDSAEARELRGRLARARATPAGDALGDPQSVLEAPGSYETAVTCVSMDPSGEQVAGVTWEGELRVWDASTGALVDRVGLDAASDRPMELVWPRSGELLVLHGSGATTLRRLGQGGRQGRKTSGGGVARSIARGPRGEFAFAGPDAFELWSEFPAVGGQPLSRAPGDFVRVGFHPGGGGLALGVERSLVWDAAGVVRAWQGAPRFGPGTSLAFSPDGARFATHVGNTLHLYAWPSLERLAAPRQVELEPGPAGAFSLRDLCFGASGEVLYSAGTTRGVSAWSATDLAPLPDVDLGWSELATALARGEDGTLFVGGQGGQLVALGPEGEPRWGPVLRPAPGLARPLELTWHGSGRLVLPAAGGYRLLDVARGLLSEPRASSRPASRVIALGESVVQLHAAGLTVDRVQVLDSGGLERESREHAPPAGARWLDAAGVGSRLWVLVRTPRQDLALNGDALGDSGFLAPHPLPALEDPRFAPAGPDPGERWVVGRDAALLLREGAPVEVVQRVKLPQRPTRAVPLGGARLAAVYPIALRGRVSTPPRHLVGIHLDAEDVWPWDAASFAVATREGLALLRTPDLSAQSVLPADATLERAAAVVRSPAGDALLVWTRRGVLLRYPLR